jgi:hypothetical protein
VEESHHIMVLAYSLSLTCACEEDSWLGQSGSLRMVVFLGLLGRYISDHHSEH